MKAKLKGQTLQPDNPASVMFLTVLINNLTVCKNRMRQQLSFFKSSKAEMKVSNLLSYVLDGARNAQLMEEGQCCTNVQKRFSACYITSWSERKEC